MPVEEYNSLKEVSMFIASIFAESKLLAYIGPQCVWFVEVNLRIYPRRLQVIELVSILGWSLADNGKLASI